jgi:hypothetical protein
MAASADVGRHRGPRHGGRRSRSSPARSPGGRGSPIEKLESALDGQAGGPEGHLLLLCGDLPLPEARRSLHPPPGGWGPIRGCAPRGRAHSELRASTPGPLACPERGEAGATAGRLGPSRDCWLEPLRVPLPDAGFRIPRGSYGYVTGIGMPARQLSVPPMVRCTPVGTPMVPTETAKPALRPVSHSEDGRGGRI